LGVGDTYTHDVPCDDCHAFYEDGNDMIHLHANDSGDVSEGDGNVFQYTNLDMLFDLTYHQCFHGVLVQVKH